MKKVIFLVAVFAMVIMLSLGAVLAQSGNSGSMAGAGNSDSSVSAGNNNAASVETSAAAIEVQERARIEAEGGTENQNVIAARIRERVEAEIGARNISELKVMIVERKQQMEAQAMGMNVQEQKVYANQNAVRTAVHALLAVRNLTGGIGQNVSEIAREFNNSVQNTIRAEAKIEKRSMISRLFFGGDDSAAGEIEANVEQNRLRIQNMNKLMNHCNCSEEVKAVMQEQIQNMEQEQTRLQQVAQNEKKSKGILGWLFKI